DEKKMSFRPIRYVISAKAVPNGTAPVSHEGAIRARLKSGDRWDHPIMVEPLPEKPWGSVWMARGAPPTSVRRGRQLRCSVRLQQMGGRTRWRIEAVARVLDRAVRQGGQLLASDARRGEGIGQSDLRPQRAQRGR